MESGLLAGPPSAARSGFRGIVNSLSAVTVFSREEEASCADAGITRRLLRRIEDVAGGASM